jgi:hypothetical protein
LVIDFFEFHLIFLLIDAGAAVAVPAIVVD